MRDSQGVLHIALELLAQDQFSTNVQHSSSYLKSAMDISMCNEQHTRLPCLLKIPCHRITTSYTLMHCVLFVLCNAGERRYKRITWLAVFSGLMTTANSTNHIAELFPYSFWLILHHKGTILSPSLLRAADFQFWISFWQFWGAGIAQLV